MRYARQTSASTGAYGRPLQTPAHSLLIQVRDARALRKQFFDPGMFGEPGWDMLLDLYEAELNQVRMMVSSVCVGSGVPATTALRWLKVMERRGLIARQSDPRDARRVFISLTPQARGAMDALFDALVAQFANLTRRPEEHVRSPF